MNEKILKNLIKATAKECVTTHLPNELALKMDGAEADYLYSTSTDRLLYSENSILLSAEWLHQ